MRRLAIVLALCLAAFGAAAQTPDPASPEAARELVSRLSDAEVRALLLERLDAVAAERAAETAEGPGLTEWVEEAAEEVSDVIGQSLLRTPDMPGRMADAFGRFFEPRGWGGLLSFLGQVAGVIAVAAAAEALARRLARPFRTGGGGRGLGAVILALLRRLVTDGAGLAAFMIVAWALTRHAMPGDSFHPLFPDSNRELAWRFISEPVLYARLAAALARFLLSPGDASLRLMSVTDEEARFFLRHLAIIGALWGLLSFGVVFFASHGANPTETPVGFWLNNLLYGWILWTTWRSRAALTRMLIGAEPAETSPMETRIARAFPAFALILVAANYLLIVYLAAIGRFDLLDGRQNLTLGILLFAQMFDTAIRGAIRHLQPPMRGEGELAARAHLSARRSWIRIGRVLVFGFVIYLVARLWGIDFHNLAAAGVGAQAAAALVRMLLILAAGYLIWELVSLWINRRLAAERTAPGFDLTADEPGGGEGGQAGGSRLSTVLPLLHGTVKVAVAVIFALLALGEIGLDITPLLAGAGIAGLAIGFGAQKLVADVVSGVFFLVDDAFRTGEYIEVAGTVGTVEKISVRSMQLRHHKGPVHTIPYGGVDKITNYSRDWVIMKLKFTVPFDTDPNKVKKIFKKIGQEMMDSPEFAPDLLQPFKSQGVFDFDDVGMIIRGKFMAKPGKQFTLRKEVFNRVKAAFEANGIEFARREVRVALPSMEGGRLTEEDKAAIAAAAGQAAREAGA